MPTSIPKIRNQYLSLFLLLAVFLGIGSAFTLYENYSFYRDSQKDELIHEAYVSNAMLEAVLSDASKIVDVSQPKIEQAINNGTLTDELAFQILSNGHTAFNSFITNTVFQLTFYADENGNIRATNRGVEKESINLTDRLYFKTLKNNPKLTYAIGNLVTAKTTGILAFHIAAPIIDSAGKFRGVIGQQVAADDLANNLSKSLKSLTDTRILVNLEGGNIAFVYPKPKDHEDIDFRLCLVINERVHADGKSSGIIEISSAKEIPQASYVAYATSSKYGLITTASIPVEKVVRDFYSSNLPLLFAIVLSFFILTFVFWRFYKKALVIADSLMLSLTDPLTGLENRRALDTEFPKFWKDSLRSRQPISALFIDIDFFKVFNDKYGHDCGDIALVAVAKAIQKCITRPLDFCCRWGGEEFAVLLPQTNERGAILLANEILEAVRAIKLDLPCDEHPKITVSIGIASMVVNEENRRDDLMDMADKAMYIAKQGGRDKYAVFDKPPPSLEG